MKKLPTKDDIRAAGDGGTGCIDPYNTVEGWGGGRKPVVSIGDGGTQVITSTDHV